MIHLLREEMVTRALETYPNPEQIPERNIQKLEDLGRERLQQMLTGWMRDAASSGARFSVVYQPGLRSTISF